MGLLIIAFDSFVLTYMYGHFDFFDAIAIASTPADINISLCWLDIIMNVFNIKY